MQRLDARPFECRVQVRVPVGPELDRREERLDDRLLLVIAAGAADRHEGLAITQHDAGRERIARARPRPQLRGAALVEPELLAAHAHADAGIAENDRAADPTAARGGLRSTSTVAYPAARSRLL